jgi:hypothetical protein
LRPFAPFVETSGVLGPSATRHPSKPLHARRRSAGGLSPPRISRTPALLPFTTSPALASGGWFDSRVLVRGSGSRVVRRPFGVGSVQLPWVSSPSGCRRSASLQGTSGLTASGACLLWISRSAGPGGMNHVGSGARCSFQLLRLAAGGLSRSSPSGTTLGVLGSALAPSVSEPLRGSWGASVELAGDGSCRGRLDLPIGRTRWAAVDGDEEGVGSAGRVRDRSRLFGSRGTGSGWTITGPQPGWCCQASGFTDRSMGRPKAPLDGSRLVRTQGPPPPEVGIHAILVASRSRSLLERGVGTTRGSRAPIRMPPASPGSLVWGAPRGSRVDRGAGEANLTRPSSRTRHRR